MNTAIVKFDLERTFKLNAEDADDFTTTVESYAQQFGYIGETARVATSCVFDPDDLNSSTFGDRMDIIGTWNQVTEDHVQKNATMLFGNWTFVATSDDNKALVTPTTEQGELTATLINHGASHDDERVLLLSCYQHEGIPGLDEYGNCEI